MECAVALRLHASLNATALAAAVGARQVTGLHARIFRRVLDELSPAERALPPREAADALRRGAWRHAAVTEALTGHAAAKIIEGRATKDTLSGWGHPDLLLPDPTLQGLRFMDSPIYSRASVRGILARLRAAAVRTTQAHGLSPLVSVAMNVAPLRPWYDKTALLLDVIDGTVPVFATIDDPHLDDILVDLWSLKAHVASRHPALRSEHATLARVNEVLRLRLGLDFVISLEVARRLVRTGAVGFVAKRSVAANRKRPVVQRLYSVADVMAAVERGECGERQLGVECDAAGRIAALRREGNTLRATARALTRLGLRTMNGARWTHSAVGTALAHAEAGQRIPAIAMPGTEP